MINILLCLNANINKITALNGIMFFQNRKNHNVSRVFTFSRYVNVHRNIGKYPYATYDNKEKITIEKVHSVFCLNNRVSTL